MSVSASTPTLTRRRVVALAWPVMLAQAASALPGLVDTAVMGRWGAAVDLAAVAVAAVVFAFLYWGFGFLRMSTTGLTAQARGRGDAVEVQALLMRGLLLAAGLGVLLWLLYPLLQLALPWVFQASEAVEAEAGRYMAARIPGAPAALIGFVVQGWLLGVGRTRSLLVVQLVLNLGNAGLDAIFVRQGLGAAGIGLGTALAEWSAALVGLWLVRHSLALPRGLWSWDRVRPMLQANVDVLVRTLALLAGFGWFVNAGARLGDAVAAGNQVLLQLVTASAFVLDAFAFIAEKETGEAVGAKDPERLSTAIWRTSELALVAGVGFAAAFYWGGPWLLGFFVKDPTARAAALAMLPWCAAVPLIGVPAYQLDGIFLGATRGAALRRAAVVSAGLYLGLDLLLRSRGWGVEGVWWAFLAMYVLRAVTLAVGVPGLWRSVRDRGGASG